MEKSHYKLRKERLVYEPPKCCMVRPFLNNTFTTTISAVSGEHSPPSGRLYSGNNQSIGRNLQNRDVSECAVAIKAMPTETEKGYVSIDSIPSELMPVLAPEVCLESKANYTYLYSPWAHKYVLLHNQISIDIISMCNGERTVTDIVSELSSLYQNIQPSVIFNDIHRMLMTLKKEGFLHEQCYRD